MNNRLNKLINSTITTTKMWTINHSKRREPKYYKKNSQHADFVKADTITTELGKYIVEDMPSILYTNNMLPNRFEDTFSDLKMNYSKSRDTKLSSTIVKVCNIIKVIFMVVWLSLNGSDCRVVFSTVVCTKYRDRYSKGRYGTVQWQVLLVDWWHRRRLLATFGWNTMRI